MQVERCWCIGNRTFFFLRLYASLSVYTRQHINLIKGVSTPLKYVEVGYRESRCASEISRVEMPIILLIVAYFEVKAKRIREFGDTSSFPLPAFGG